VTVERMLPRFVNPKDVAGRTRCYWTLPSCYCKLGRTLHKEHSATRDDVYAFAWGAVAAGHLDAAACRRDLF
jgi:hypothetical protein